MSLKAFEDYPAGKTEAQWRQYLGEDHFKIFSNDVRFGTQLAHSGNLDNFQPTEGYFVCSACTQPLYLAEHKIVHPCGWASFNDNMRGCVGVREDDNDASRGIYPAREEIFCKGCGGHLGHRFPHEQNWRDCVNSICLAYKQSDFTQPQEQAASGKSENRRNSKS